MFEKDIFSRVKFSQKIKQNAKKLRDRRRYTADELSAIFLPMQDSLDAMIGKRHSALSLMDKQQRSRLVYLSKSSDQIALILEYERPEHKPKSGKTTVDNDSAMPAFVNKSDVAEEFCERFYGREDIDYNDVHNFVSHMQYLHGDMPLMLYWECEVGLEAINQSTYHGPKPLPQIDAEHLLERFHVLEQMVIRDGLPDSISELNFCQLGKRIYHGTSEKDSPMYTFYNSYLKENATQKPTLSQSLRLEIQLLKEKINIKNKISQ